MNVIDSMYLAAHPPSVRDGLRRPNHEVRLCTLHPVTLMLRYIDIERLNKEFPANQLIHRLQISYLTTIIGLGTSRRSQKWPYIPQQS